MSECGVFWNVMLLIHTWRCCCYEKGNHHQHAVSLKNHGGLIMDNANSPARIKTKKRISSYFYTHGKFGRRWREIVDTDNPFLYSHGRYLTKITPADLPEDYIKIHSRSIWYMSGYLKTSGVVDMYYTYC